MKGKALFQIILVIGTMFSVSFIAEPVQAQQQVCCEETISGDFCQYTTQDQCAPGSLSAPTNCEQTSFCKLGCGYINNEGRCFKNTPRAACDENEECYWDESVTCEIPQCQQGCCQLSNECSFTTQAACRNAAADYPGLDFTFDETIITETACINECRSLEEGACVAADGSCTFGTRETCIETRETIDENATAINPNVGFHPEILCSNPQLGTNCAPQQYTGCQDDEDGVYWFDSCGNPENIYNSNKRASYNDGFIQDPEDACTINGPGDKDCGNCNFVTGTLCDVFEGRDEKPTVGDYICRDLSCDVESASVTSPSSFTRKKLGESFCAYDSLVGFGLDPVGSRHYRKLCINGEILTEPCADFREELCIQGVQGNPPLTNEESIELIPDGAQYIEASCRDNRWESCNSLNAQIDALDAEDFGSENFVKTVQRAKEDCENIQGRDCQWVGDDNFGMCIPFVPPGLKFWPGEGEGAVPSTDATAQCEAGSQSCEVMYERPGIGLLEGGREWKCVQNCECLEKDWLRGANDICKSMGDCGAYVNYLGKGTTEGLVENVEGHDITLGDVDGYRNKVLVDGRNRGEYDDGFGLFFDRTWPVLALVGLELIAFNMFDVGATSAVTSTATGGAAAGALGTCSGGACATPVKEVVQEAVTETVTETTSSGYELISFGEGAGTAQTAISVINTLAIIYTVYNILDILLADTKTETISFTCEPWVAPLGGDDCEKCGDDGKPCSEYRCRSLGQLCSLVNQGSEEERCINSNPNDVNSPILTPNKEVLLPGYTITEVAGAGFEVDQKIPPFTPVTVGITTNEVAQCKYSLETNKDYESKDADFGSPLFTDNHTLALSLPSELAEEQVLRLTNGGEYTLYVRCQDASGNVNNRDYYVKFAIEEGPDLTPPSIELTSIANNAFVAADTNETALSIYVNEPAECKWSETDLDYELMTNDFTCASTAFQQSSIYAGLYECETELTDSKRNQKNDFFFRCKDKPLAPEEDRNVNIESFEYSLRGSIPLEITDISPEGDLFDASPTLRVSTIKGANQGAATCEIGRASCRERVYAPV